MVFDGGFFAGINRPYSCADVTVNLRGTYTKGVVQKALDGLSETGKIKCKLYGKQKVYAAIQHDEITADSDVEGRYTIYIKQIKIVGKLLLTILYE